MGSSANPSAAAAEVTRLLLNIEHRNFGYKLGLLAESAGPIDDAFLVRTAAVIDSLSREEGVLERRLVMQLSALLWEHCSDGSKGELREFLVVILSRIGIAPSIAMIDEHFAKEGQFEQLSSYLSEVATVIHQLRTEVQVCGKVFLLTDFQRGVLAGIRGKGHVGISAPTSSGKSFAIYLAIADYLSCNAGQVMYVVPTLSLLNQVSHDLSALMRELNLHDVLIASAYEVLPNDKAIFVVTQERAMSAIDEYGHLEHLRVLIVDEVQNVERVANEGELRSKILLDMMKELNDQSFLECVVLSGPRLSNIGELGRHIFDAETLALDSALAPVASITYSITKQGRDYYLKQYVDTTELPEALRIDYPTKIAGLGGALYNPAFLDFLHALLSSLGNSERNIIFSPTAPQARKTALALYERGQQQSVSDSVQELSKYLSQTVHPEYPLAKSVLGGIAYHSSRVPPHVRIAVEMAFKDELLNNLVCTTSLMQGVNLPANNVIVRNPRLFIRKGHDASELSAYEFANLRGRAGRLLRDFIGRSIVLDEAAFQPSGQEVLFADEYKNLRPGYATIFTSHRSEIVKHLDQTTTPAGGPEKLLLIYIGQTLLRMGSGGAERLSSVGIDLTESEIRDSLSALSALRLPASAYISHRFWDPYDLDALFHPMSSAVVPVLPSNLFESGLAEIIVKVLRFHLDTSAYYVERYLKVSAPSDKFLKYICDTAVRWAREEELSSLLKWHSPSDDAGEAIEGQLSLILREIMYGLPSLLKPFAHRFSPDSAILPAIEMGAFHPVTRELIGLGLSRDTAIRIRKGVLSDVTGAAPESRALRQALLGHRNDLDTWTKREVEFVFGL